ncbi:2-hydroxymuconate semialdehyde hydrolase [compost metagenome]|uniref:alpha/beta fold hydrolase n=1 Tax=Pseudomonas TaxID=286 RepID=UPI00040BAAFC|nr:MULTISPECIES: alpha/beta hydrolase [Pseudomonas]PRA58111.1 alpha/beta hydrolase [Pseudomonas sp. MYb187]
MTTPQSGYAPVNGLHLYYEIHGEHQADQPPLILLHGGGDTIETSFAQLLPALAAERQVIAFEQQGYGHTADIVERAFSFVQSADDTAGLLAHLGIGQADLFGFSNGGTIAALVAIRHPRRVRKLMLASALVSRAGAYTWLWELIDSASLQTMPEALQQAYLAVAPEPGHLQLMHDKAVRRMREFQDIAPEVIGGITAPTLIVVGDSDVVRPEHAVELFRLLPQAQLVVLPGTDHLQVTARTEWLVPMIGAFLQEWPTNQPVVPAADQTASS